LQKINFDGYCSYSTNTIYDYDTYIVEWTGASVYATPCTISFEADGFDSDDDYQICVDVEEYYIDNADCNVQLTYNQGINVSVTMYIYVAVGVAMFIIVLTVCIMVIKISRIRNNQRRAAQLNINPSQSYQSINTSGAFHQPYGVEGPSTIHNYPPAYGYQGYLKSSRATPPPPYSVPK
ncbi:hypothetical protein KUTeg_021327, partial [Tegillarca granosa]